MLLIELINFIINKNKLVILYLFKSLKFVVNFYFCGIFDLLMMM